MLNSVEYTSDIEELILANLDGWVVKTETSNNNSSSNDGVDPFMTSTELEQKANKVITSTECELFYEEALDLAYEHTNRLNIDDLATAEAGMFIRAVCKWAASNLWNKYNIRVSNEDLEDTYIQSYGGLLYKSALKSLQPFIIQIIQGMNSFTKETDDVNPWM